MSTLEQLAARCSPQGGPVSEPLRELNVEIWLSVTLGATRRQWTYKHEASGKECHVDETRDGNSRLIIVPAYTTSLDAAASLIPEGHDWILEHVNGGMTIGARVGHNDPDKTSWGDTAALALCAAALRARAGL
jgi:hypothetical protein